MKTGRRGEEHGMTGLAAGSGVVVTGGGRGIGEALARRLAAGGARVVVNDLDADAAKHVANDIGGQAVPGDVSTEAGVEALVENATERLGGAIDAWYGNAGVDVGHGLEAPDDEWATAIDVNVLAHVRAARLLVPGWAERGSGRFVVTASAAGLLTLLGGPTYSVTKHGAVAFAEWLSATYRHRGVVVQAICPLGVNTRMLAGSGAMKDVLTHDGALEPADVAEAAWDALSDDRFLILPHPVAGEYYRARASDTDRWLRGMNKLQQSLERKEAGQ
jgi:NAD(P)-dependent dehydrogenase (short-subunit alcohol dehydrogenase family)